MFGRHTVSTPKIAKPAPLAPSTPVVGAPVAIANRTWPRPARIPDAKKNPTKRREPTARSTSGPKNKITMLLPMMWNSPNRECESTEVTHVQTLPIASDRRTKIWLWAASPKKGGLRPTARGT